MPASPSKLLAASKPSPFKPSSETSIETTPSPPNLNLTQILSSRHWIFDSVLAIRITNANKNKVLSRSELITAVSSEKNINVNQIDVCFYSEKDLSHSIVPAGNTDTLSSLPTRADVVCIWRTNYPPSVAVRTSRNWPKTVKLQKVHGARWFLITAIREDGLNPAQDIVTKVDADEDDDDGGEGEGGEEGWLPDMDKYDDRHKVKVENRNRRMSER